MARRDNRTHHQPIDWSQGQSFTMAEAVEDGDRIAEHGRRREEGKATGAKFAALRSMAMQTLGRSDRHLDAKGRLAALREDARYAALPAAAQAAWRGLADSTAASIAAGNRGPACQAIEELARQQATEELEEWDVPEPEAAESPTELAAQVPR